MRLTRNVLALLLGLAVLLTYTGCAQAGGDAADADHDKHAEHAEDDGHGDHKEAPADKDAPKAQALANYVAAPYPLDTCVVAGGKLGSMGKPVTQVHEGREVKFCCAGCKPKFEADPDAYLKKIDAAVIEQQSASYPLETCTISGDKLGDKPIDFVYENRLVRFCCKMCVDGFLKDPNTSLAKLNAAAVKAQMADYPAKKCPVTDADLGSMGKPIDMMVGHRLVRLCCAGCDKKVKADPVGMLNKVYGSPAKPEAE